MVVSTLVNVMLAPAITAPVGSLTVPLTVPRLVCAHAVSDRPTSSNAQKNALNFMFPPWDIWTNSRFVLLGARRGSGTRRSFATRLALVDRTWIHIQSD